MILSWLSHAALSVLWALILWSAVLAVQRLLPSLVETVLCTLTPIAWYWSRESTQYERYRHYRAGYIERLLPWNWSEDQIGDLLVPVCVLALLVVAYAIVRTARPARQDRAAAAAGPVAPGDGDRLRA